MFNKSIINSDVEIKERYHAVAISKSDFLQKLTEYVMSDEIFTKIELDDYDAEDIVENQESIQEHLKKKEFDYATFGIMSIMFTVCELTSVNGYGISNSEPYGYNPKKKEKDFENMHEYLSSNVCDRGLYTFENGVTMWFIEAENDEYYTVNVALYYDGKDFKFYHPVCGNYLNIVTNHPVGMGTDYVREKDLDKVNAFIEAEIAKYSKEELEIITQHIDDEEKLVDLLYLAKYGYQMNDNKEVLDIATGERMPEYDIESIEKEIRKVFEI